MLWNGHWGDVTEQKEMELALDRARRQADAANQAKSDFLANMSHEIRTPMNAIMGLGDLLMATELDRRQRGYIENIMGAAQTLLGIINDILDLSKIEAGRLELEHIPFNLAEVLDKLGSMVGVRATEKNLEFIFDVATDVPMDLVGDPLRLARCWST